MTVEVIPVRGIPEVSEGDDLPTLIAAALSETALDLREGDVVAVTQKAVSKSEGRLVPDGGRKKEWVAREARRIVARRGGLVIVETRHGLVCANAGVDASNVAEGLLSLLPEDPDASAELIRKGLRERTGIEAGVVVTDTFGRPWRRGVVNVAIGCSGLPPLVDLRGTPDHLGRSLEVTMVALADEVAAAVGLVMGKADRVPAAVVRGLSPPNHAPPGPARTLVRSAPDDLFPWSPLQAISARRTIREFGDGEVPREALLEAVAAALTAPVPHGSRHRSRPWAWVLLDRGAARRRLLGAMAAAWRRDLSGNGVPESTIARRLVRSDAILGTAPVLAVPFLSLGAADEYPDARRREAEPLTKRTRAEAARPAASGADRSRARTPRGFASSARRPALKGARNRITGGSVMQDVTPCGTSHCAPIWWPSRCDSPTPVFMSPEMAIHAQT